MTRKILFSIGLIAGFMSGVTKAAIDDQTQDGALVHLFAECSKDVEEGVPIRHEVNERRILYVQKLSCGGSTYAIQWTDGTIECRHEHPTISRRFTTLGEEVFHTLKRLHDE